MGCNRKQLFCSLIALSVFVVLLLNCSILKFHQFVPFITVLKDNSYVYIKSSVTKPHSKPTPIDLTAKKNITQPAERHFDIVNAIDKNIFSCRF